MTKTIISHFKKNYFFKKTSTYLSDNVKFFLKIPFNPSVAANDTINHPQHTDDTHLRASELIDESNNPQKPTHTTTSRHRIAIHTCN